MDGGGVAGGTEEIHNQKQLLKILGSVLAAAHPKPIGVPYLTARAPPLAPPLAHKVGDLALWLERFHAVEIVVTRGASADGSPLVGLTDVGAERWGYVEPTTTTAAEAEEAEVRSSLAVSQRDAVFSELSAVAARKRRDGNGSSGGEAVVGYSGGGDGGDGGDGADGYSGGGGGGGGDNDEIAALRAAAKARARFQKSSYWKELCPMLHVDDPTMASAVASNKDVFEPAALEANHLRTDLLIDGVFMIPPEGLDWQVDLSAMAAAAKILHEHGLPPHALLMYDEPWVMAAQLKRLLEATVAPGHAINFDWASFYVDPSSANEGDRAGWSPHRDRPVYTDASFREDGSAKYTTTWIALTDANPETSCLYCVPARDDPAYFKSDGDAAPTANACPDNDSFGNIRALPTRAGGLVTFTHRLLHWGSRADARACARKGALPRMAIAFGASDPKEYPPFFAASHGPIPKVTLRAALVAGQALVYGSRATMTEERIGLYWDVYRARATEFAPHYRKSVASYRALCRFNASKSKMKGEAGHDEAEAANEVEAANEAEAVEAGTGAGDEAEAEAGAEAEAAEDAANEVRRRHHALFAAPETGDGLHVQFSSDADAEPTSPMSPTLGVTPRAWIASHTEGSWRGPGQVSGEGAENVSRTQGARGNLLPAEIESNLASSEVEVRRQELDVRQADLRSQMEAAQRRMRDSLTLLQAELQNP